MPIPKKKKPLPKSKPKPNTKSEKLWTPGELGGDDPQALANDLFNNHKWYKQLKRIVQMIDAPETFVVNKLLHCDMETLKEIETHLGKKLRNA